MDLLNFKPNNIIIKDEEQYFSADEDENIEFDLRKKIIDRNNDGSCIVKLTARELIYYVSIWCFNREIVEERVEELYENHLITKKKSTINPLWMFHLIYDDKSDPNYKLFMLDGQHRREVIRRILEDDIDMKFQQEYYCIVYFIDLCETVNKKKAIELFKKINNNKQFNKEDLPDDFVTDLLNMMMFDNVLKHGIKKSEKNESAQEPCIHVKQLNALFNANIDKIRHMTHDDILLNLKKINNKLSLKEYKSLFSNRSQKKEEINKKAKDKNFYLNLKSSKYPPSKWIIFINNPSEL